MSTSSGPILKPLVRLTIPNTVANILAISPLLVEAWRIAALGKNELAGVAMVFPIFMLTVMWSAGSIGGAVSGAVARALGANDKLKAESVARSAMVIAVCGGLIMTALVFTGGHALFAWFGAEGAVLSSAWAYTGVLFTFNVLIWLFNIASAILRGAGDMVRPLFGFGLIFVLHLLGSKPFIIGTGSFDGWGVAGAAALLVLANACALALMIFYLAQAKAPVRLRFGAIDWRLTGQVLKPGLFASSQTLATIVTSLLLTGYAARFGAEVLAGYGLGARIELLMIPMIFGVGGAAITLAGSATGAGDYHRAVKIGWITAATAAVIVGGIGILLAALARLWVPLFSDNAVISQTLIAYIQMVGPFYAFLAIGLALYFTSQGMGTLLYPVLGAMLRLLIVISGGLILSSSQNASVDALLIIIAFAMFFYGVFIAAGLWLGPWRKKNKV